MRENSFAHINNSGNKLMLIENLKTTSTTNKSANRKKAVQVPVSTKKKELEVESSDTAYIKNLQLVVKELSEENQKLKEKNAELEACLAAAQDEIEERESALVEMAGAYDELLRKFNELATSSKPKKEKGKKNEKSK